MNGELIIRLTDDDDHCSWLPIDAGGRAMGAVQRGALAQAAAMANERRVTVLVPGARALVTRVRIPGVHGARLRQAVPYAMEENVVEDLDALHFACGAPDADGAVTVAAVSRAAMDGWLARLRTAGIQARRMLVDFTAVPRDDAVVTVVDEDGHQALVRMADGAGFAGPAALVPTLVDDDARRLVVPQGVDVPAAFSDWADRRILAGGLLPWLAGAVAGAGPDLLQGDYAVRLHAGVQMARWRVPAALAAAVVGVAILGWALEFVALQREHARLQEQVSARFATLVPNEPMSSDPRQQVMRRMGIAGAGGGDMLPLLEAVSAALADEPGVEITALAYRPGVMEVSVSAARAEQIEQIRARIDARGMPTSIVGATSRGDRVDGRLAVRGGP